MKEYKVYLWCGSGYLLDEFHTVASCEEEALCNVVAKIVNEKKSCYYLTEEEYSELFAEELADNEEFESEQYVYIDATMEGAESPVYLLIENAKILEAA